MKCNITEREYLVLKMHLTDKMTLTKIGKILGVSCERIRQIRNKAIRKLSRDVGTGMLKNA